MEENKNNEPGDLVNFDQEPFDLEANPEAEDASESKSANGGVMLSG
jgi:hypothetical protein